MVVKLNLLGSEVVRSSAVVTLLSSKVVSSKVVIAMDWMAGWKGSTWL